MAEWSELARHDGRAVAIKYIGAHEFAVALTQPGQGGRLRYWFNSDVFDTESQQRLLDAVIVKAGRRYTPKAHVEVEPIRAIDAVARSDRYILRWRSALASLRSARRFGWRAPAHIAALVDRLERVNAALDAADSAVASLIEALSSISDLPDPAAHLRAAESAVHELHSDLYQYAAPRNGRFTDEAEPLFRYSDALVALHNLIDLVTGPEMSAARVRVVAITGRAGTGKTHLLCDAAAVRVKNNQPTLLFLGQEFDRRAISTQLAELARFDGSYRELLLTLDAASETAGAIGLVMVDALNESERPEAWSDQLAGLVHVHALARCLVGHARW